MTVSAHEEPYRATAARITASFLEVTLTDGRTIRVPLDFYPTLVKATPSQRRDLRVSPQGVAVEWEELDFGLSIDSIVAGRREHVPPRGYFERLDAHLAKHGLSRKPEPRRRVA
ncbi:MAG: DUF2442 domain-containing protein [Phycisphaerales bacterium]